MSQPTSKERFRRYLPHAMRAVADWRTWPVQKLEELQCYAIAMSEEINRLNDLNIELSRANAAASAHEPLSDQQAAERAASIAISAAGKHAERVVELEAEVSTLRESLAEVNRLLSLNVREVERLRSAPPPLSEYQPKFKPGDQIKLGARSGVYDVLSVQPTYGIGVAGRWLMNCAEHDLLPASSETKMK